MQACKGLFYIFISMEAEIWLFWWLVLILLLVSANEGNEEDVDIGGDEIPISSFPPVEIERDTAVRNSKSSSSSSSSSGSGSASSGLCYFEAFEFSHSGLVKIYQINLL